MGSAAKENSADFITSEFLENVLKTKISSFTVRPGSSLGDNYTSVLYGIEVKLAGQEGNPQHLLLKAYPPDIARQKFLEDSKIFAKELGVYSILVPELIKFADEQSKIGTGKGKPALRPPFPPFIHGAASKNFGDDDNEVASGANDPINQLDNYILMVDLRKTGGFKMADRLAGLDFDHCSLVMTQLAKFHALNWSYLTHNGLDSMNDKFPHLFTDIFLQNTELLKMMTNGNYAMLRPVLENALGVDSEAVKGFNKFFTGFAEKPLEHFFMFIRDGRPIDDDCVLKLLRVKPKDGNSSGKVPWTVGNHGDCWLNNMLFKYCSNSGKPLESVLLDLQIVREACPTVDLAYFFYTSTTHETRKKHLDTLLNFYAEKFLGFCQQLNSPPLPEFSAVELKRRFHRSKIFGLMSAALVLPIIIQTADSVVDLSTLKIDAADSSSESDQDQMVKAMEQVTKNAGKNLVLRERIVGITEELYNDGII